MIQGFAAFVGKIKHATSVPNQVNGITDVRTPSRSTDDLEAVTSSIIDELHHKNKGIHTKRTCEMCRYQEQLKTLIADVLKNQRQIKHEKDNLLTQMRRLREENGKLTDECKETKLQLNSVKDELKRLKRNNISMHTTNYEQWSSDEVVDWLVTMEDGKFEKYEEKLRMSFNKEGVNGNGLRYVNQSELKGWGIESFMERGIINAQIQKLITQNSNTNSNEGQ